MMKAESRKVQTNERAQMSQITKHRQPLTEVVYLLEMYKEYMPRLNPFFSKRRQIYTMVTYKNGHSTENTKRFSSLRKSATHKIESQKRATGFPLIKNKVHVKAQINKSEKSMQYLCYRVYRVQGWKIKMGWQDQIARGYGLLFKNLHFILQAMGR